jgi:dTDP-4-dehydrorhamnose reductase
MKVLITGANGMVARAAAEYCRSIGDDVIALERQALDISDRDAVLYRINADRPDAILNCAAYTDVDGAEKNQEASRLANTVGPANLAEAARETGARFVTISTDYVFDGGNPGFYTELDEPNPRGVYAVTKYEGELAACEANPDSVIVRSGWIYGRGGTNFLSVMHRLLGEGKNIKAISDSYGTPTFGNDLARRLRELAETDEVGLFHVTNSGEGTSYLGFAEKICRLRGYDRNLIQSVSHVDLQRPAPRPVSSRLATTRTGFEPLPNWEQALERFLNSD